MPNDTTWTVLDEATGLLTRAYDFTPTAEARMALVRFGDRELCAISPACGLRDEDFRALGAYGRVTALIAPNGFHHLGVPEWRRAFPDARVYAPDKAAARIRKKSPASGEIEPLSALAAKLPKGVRVLDVPYQKKGETWLVVDTARGPAWYVSDSCLNLRQLPKPFLIRQIFAWTKSGPDLAINGVQKMLFCSDKKAYKTWFLSQLDGGAPTILITAHGPVLEGGELGERLRRLANERL